MNRRTSILIVDDHPLFVTALRHVLSEIAPEADVVVAGSLSAARRTVETQGAPRMVLLDLNLPDSPGSQTIKLLPELFGGIPTVVISSLDDTQRRQQALAVGARAFISKSEKPEKIMSALTELLQGRTPELPAPVPMASELSARQQEVMELIAAGKSNKEVARDLGLAVGTVKVHLREIFERLGARNRTEAVTRYGVARNP